MEREEIIQELVSRLGIEISRFDSCYITINLLFDGEAIASHQADVPAYDILNHMDNY